MESFNVYITAIAHPDAPKEGAFGGIAFATHTDDGANPDWDTRTLTRFAEAQKYWGTEESVTLDVRVGDVDLTYHFCAHADVQIQLALALTSGYLIDFDFAIEQIAIATYNEHKAKK